MVARRRFAGMPNEEQAEYWNGPGGAHWVAEQDRYDQLVGGFGERLLAAADPQPRQQVLDIGCGNGAVALACAERVRPDGLVLGVDISRPMLAAASARAEATGLTNVRFEPGDAQIHGFETESFDLVVSRFGVMFFDEPAAAFTNLARALKPGGRLAFVCWQDLLENEWIMVPVAAALQYVPMPDLGEPGAPGPFSLADPERIAAILSSAGLKTAEPESVEEPMTLGADTEDVVAFAKGTDMAQVLMEGVDDETARAAWDAVADAFAERLRPDGVVLSGKAWLVTATKP